MLQMRQAAEQAAQARRERLIPARHNPWRRALEHKEPFGVAGQPRHVLNGAGPGADRGDALAGGFECGVPRRRVKPRTGETLQAWNRGNMRPVQRPHGRDDKARRHFLMIARMNAPEPGAGIEVERVDVGIEADMGIDVKAGGAGLEIGQDLGLGWVPPRPVGVLVE